MPDVPEIPAHEPGATPRLRRREPGPRVPHHPVTGKYLEDPRQWLVTEDGTICYVGLTVAYVEAAERQARGIGMTLVERLTSGEVEPGAVAQVAARALSMLKRADLARLSIEQGWTR